MAASRQREECLDEGRGAVVPNKEIEMGRKYKRVAMSIAGALFIGGVIKLALPVQSQRGPVVAVDMCVRQTREGVVVRPCAEKEARFTSVLSSAFRDQQTNFREPIY